MASCKFCGKSADNQIVGVGWICDACTETWEMDEKTAALDEGSDDF